MGCRLERARSRRNHVHYDEAIELTSPVARRYCVCGRHSGRKGSAESYFQRGLEAYPDLHFGLEDVFVALIASCWSIPTRRERALESSWALSHRESGPRHRAL